MPARVPEVLAAWMRPFRGYFTTAVCLSNSLEL